MQYNHTIELGFYVGAVLVKDTFNIALTLRVIGELTLLRSLNGFNQIVKEN